MPTGRGATEQWNFAKDTRSTRYRDLAGIISRKGVVMEDGSTLPEVIEFLEKRFTELLQDVGGQTVSQLVVKHDKQGDRQ